MSIRHAEIIRAILDGRTIQITDHFGNVSPDWAEFAGTEALRKVVRDSRENYRVKPEPQILWCSIANNGRGPVCLRDFQEDEKGARESAGDLGGKVLRLEVDPDTMAVIGHRTEAP